MQLIPQWRQSLRLYSVRVLLAIAALPAAWATVPDEVKALIPLPWMPWILTALAVAGVIARLVDQRTPEERQADEVAHEIARLDDDAVAARLRERAGRD